MPVPADMLTVAEAAAELGVSPTTIRRAVGNDRISPHTLNGRTYLIPRSEVERYRRDSLGNRGGRRRPDDDLTEQQRKQRAYQQAYYQRRKAAREQQPATSREPAE
jgi:excisionase family DNA binding protein